MSDRHKRRLGIGLFYVVTGLMISFLGGVCAVEFGLHWMFGAVGIHSIFPVSYVLGTIADKAGVLPE